MANPLQPSAKPHSAGRYGLWYEASRGFLHTSGCSDVIPSAPIGLQVGCHISGFTKKREQINDNFAGCNAQVA